MVKLRNIIQKAIIQVKHTSTLKAHFLDNFWQLKT